MELKTEPNKNILPIVLKIHGIEIGKFVGCYYDLYVHLQQAAVRHRLSSAIYKSIESEKKAYGPTLSTVGLDLVTKTLAVCDMTAADVFLFIANGISEAPPDQLFPWDDDRLMGLDVSKIDTEEIVTVPQLPVKLVYREDP